MANTSKRKMKRLSRKEMLKQEGFKLALGISIILLGVMSIFYDTSSTILIGISVSYLLFNIIDLLAPKKSFWQFITISILLLFCIFPSIEYIKEFLNPKINNAIIFFSFGISFLISAHKTYRNILKNKELQNKYLIDNATSINHQFDNYIYLLNDLQKMRNLLMKENFNRVEMSNVLGSTQEFIKNEYVVSKTKYDLSLIGQSDIKDTFSLGEIEKAIQSTSLISKEKEVKEELPVKETKEVKEKSTKKNTKKVNKDE